MNNQFSDFTTDELLADIEDPVAQEFFKRLIEANQKLRSRIADLEFKILSDNECMLYMKWLVVCCTVFFAWCYLYNRLPRNWTSESWVPEPWSLMAVLVSAALGWWLTEKLGSQKFLDSLAVCG